MYREKENERVLAVTRESCSTRLNTETNRFKDLRTAILH